MTEASMSCLYVDSSGAHHCMRCHRVYYDGPAACVDPDGEDCRGAQIASLRTQLAEATARAESACHERDLFECALNDMTAERDAAIARAERERLVAELKSQLLENNWREAESERVAAIAHAERAERERDSERARRIEAVEALNASEIEFGQDRDALERDRDEARAQLAEARPLADAFITIRNDIIGMIYEDGTPYEPSEVVEAVRSINDADPNAQIEAIELRERLAEALQRVEHHEKRVPRAEVERDHALKRAEQAESRVLSAECVDIARAQMREALRFVANLRTDPVAAAHAQKLEAALAELDTKYPESPDGCGGGA